jgi:hypothetical protein
MKITQSFNNNKTTETFKEIEKAEQKARDIANFSITIADKWESRLIQRNQKQEIQAK